MSFDGVVNVFLLRKLVSLVVVGIVPCRSVKIRHFIRRNGRRGRYRFARFGIIIQVDYRFERTCMARVGIADKVCLCRCVVLRPCPACKAIFVTEAHQGNFLHICVCFAVALDSRCVLLFTAGGAGRLFDDLGVFNDRLFHVVYLFGIVKIDKVSENINFVAIARPFKADKLDRTLCRSNVARRADHALCGVLVVVPVFIRVKLAVLVPDLIGGRAKLAVKLVDRPGCERVVKNACAEVLCNVLRDDLCSTAVLRYGRAYDLALIIDGKGRCKAALFKLYLFALFFCAEIRKDGRAGPPSSIAESVFR